MLFWRCNPSFGLFGIKDEIKPVPMALSEVLNEVILPKAKRETSAQFRDSATGGMKDPGVIDALKKGREKVLKWYKDTTSNDADEDVISDKIGFTEWMRVCDRQDLVGTWTVEQMSAITGDTSCSGEIQCRLSVPQIKAAFMDSQAGDKLAVGQGDVLDDHVVVNREQLVERAAGERGAVSDVMLWPRGAGGAQQAEVSSLGDLDGQRVPHAEGIEAWHN